MSGVSPLKWSILEIFWTSLSDLNFCCWKELLPPSNSFSSSLILWFLTSIMFSLMNEHWTPAVSWNLECLVWTFLFTNSFSWCFFILLYFFSIRRRLSSFYISSWSFLELNFSLKFARTLDIFYFSLSGTVCISESLSFESLSTWFLLRALFYLMSSNSAIFFSFSISLYIWSKYWFSFLWLRL